MAHIIKTHVIPISMKTHWDTYDIEFNKGIYEIVTKTKEENPVGKTVGELLKFSVIGGWAYYIVAKEDPLELIFVDVDDGLTLPPDQIEKLRLYNITTMVRRQHRVR